MSNDEDLYFTFELGDNDNIDAEFELEENDSIDCLFEINAAGAVWGGITGTLSNQEDLQAALDLKADKSELDADVEIINQTITENYNTLDGKIDTINSALLGDISALDSVVSSNYTTLDGKIDSINGALTDSINGIDSIISGYGNIVTHNVSEFATASQGGLADTALQPNDNISELNNNVGYITSASLPTVNDGSLTIQVNGSDVATFTANQEGDTIANIEVPDSATWGNISGDISDQTDLQDALNLKANATDVESITGALSDSITALDSIIGGYGDIVTYNASYFATAAQGALANTALQPNDNISLLTNNAGYITKAVNDLTNYYLKSETYTKLEVQQLIASIPQFSVEVVQSLPITGERMVLYLVPKDGEAPDVYDEYIWVEDEEEFELIGSTAVDLSDYVTNSDLATALSDYALSSDIPTDNSELTNGAGYITGINQADVIDALGYTPYNATNPNGYITNSALNGYATETYVNNGLATKQNTLTAGDNIQIQNNVISATDTTYTAGTGISIENGVISNTQTSAEWGNIQGDIADQTDLQNVLDEKQGKLTAGTDLEILTTPSATITATGTDEISMSSVVKGGINSIVADGFTTNKSIIPDGYTQYLYLRNGSAAKIDTGFCPTVDDLVFDIRFYAGGTSSMYLWESRDTALLNILGIGGAQNGSTITLYTGSSTYIVSNISRTGGHVYHVIGTLKNGNATLYVKDETDNIEDTVTGTYTFSANETNMYFFGNENQYVGSGYRIYTAKCWYQGNLVQYWLPATNSEDANGIYNIIDNTFLTGEGNLLVGVEVTSPAMERPMNIVCNNGVLRANAQKQIYVDGNVETLELRSKNLWSPDNTMSGVGYTVTTTPYGFTCTAQASTGNSSRVIIYCDVAQFKANTTYIIGGIDGYKSVYVGRTVDGVNDTSYYKNGGSGRYFTVTDIAEGQTKVLISIYLGAKEQGFIFDFSNIQIEVGNVSTSYTLPYDSQTATAENLYKVYSYADVQNITTGTVTRKIYAITFDGSENWSLAKSGSIYRYNFSLRASGYPDPYTPTSQRGHVISTHFTDIGGSTAQTLGGAFTYSSIYLYVIPSDQTITTATEFKAWLAQQKAEGTPLIVLYERSTAKTETVTAQPLQPLQRGDSVLSITQSSINNLPLSVNYDKSEINIINFTNDTGYITDSALTDYVTTSTLATTLTDYVETTTLTSTLTDYVTTSTLTSTLTDYVETTTLATVATSGSYNDLTDKPTIPTVNDATITFTQGGTTKGTITLNQSSNQTIALDAGGGGSTIPNPAYGTSSTAAATAQKEVSIPAITELNVGQVIMVRPSTTSTVASSTIKLNNFDAYPMRYNNANITTSTDSIVWNASFISSFMFDGTYWQFIGHGIDSNTTYSNMSVSEGTTGTATSARTMRADYLKQIIQGTKLTGLDISDNSAVEATDSILTGIGKLQAEVNNTISADAIDYLLSDREDAFDIQSPLTMTYTHNGNGSFQNGITMNSDGTLTTGNPDLYFGFDKGFGTAIPQTAYWEFNFKFKRISTSSTDVPFFVVDDVDVNFVELYLSDYNMPVDTWIYCNVLHREGASNVEFRYTVNGSETLVNNVLISGYTLSSNKYVNLIGLGISEIFSLDWDTYYRYSRDDRRNVFTDRTLGAESEIFIAEYNVTSWNDIVSAYNSGKTIICKYLQEGGSSDIFNYPQYSFGCLMNVRKNTGDLVFITFYFELCSISVNSTNWSKSSKSILREAVQNNTEYISPYSQYFGVLSTDDYTTVYNLIDTTTGLIPDARISSNIARTSAIPTVPTNISAFTNDSGYITGITLSNVTNALGYTPSDNTLSNVSSIDSGSAVATALNGKSDTDLSNLSSTGKAVIDGQWVASWQDIISSAVSLNGSTDLTYTVALPNDGYVYEAMIRADANTASSSGNFIIVQIKSNIFSNYLNICGNRTRTTSSVGAQGTVIIPMKYGTNNLYLHRSTNYNGTTTLQLLGYRRVGTNT